MIFEAAEYAARLRAVRTAMRERGVDLLVLDEVEHLAYVAGWHGSGSMFFVR